MLSSNKENRLTENRAQRVPVSGIRDILSVYGKDATKEYRFVKDKDENGLRIQNFKRGGWEFTDAKKGEITVGDEHVYKSKKGNVGSIIRYPAGEGEWLYLMEIRKEWYDQDQADKAQRINDMESNITRKRSPDNNEHGQYGDIKVEERNQP